MSRGLEKRKNRSLRVAHDGPAAYPFHGGRRHQRASAKLFRFLGKLVAIRDVKVDQPVSRGLRIAIARGRDAADMFFSRLYVQITAGVAFCGFDFPPEYLRIERRHASRIRRNQIGPAKRPIDSRNLRSWVFLRLPN